MRKTSRDRFRNPRKLSLKTRQPSVDNETMRLVNLRELRESYGYSIEKMAGVLKIEPLILKAMEQGTIELKQDMLVRIKLLIMGEL